LPGQENINYVKRLVGLPGETIKVVDGLIYIKKQGFDDFEVIDQIEDGLFLDDQYKVNINQLVESGYKILNLTDNGPLDYTPEYIIPDNKFFFMGDNRDNSSDSRVMSGVGFVPKENIIGRVWFIWFSVDTDFRLSRFWKLPLHIRYDRLFNIVN
jgi:signal peptidase I